jgi:cytochrome c-type biogenesis protein CcsB
MDTTTLLGGAFAGYGLSALLYLIHGRIRRPFLRRSALGLTVAAFLLQTGVLVGRWTSAGYLPVTNLFSTLVFFSWTLAATYLYFELRYRIHGAGLFVMLLNLLLLGFALPRSPAIPPLIPELNTPLFTMHIFFSFLGYAFFAMAFSLGVLYLVQRRAESSLLPELTELRRLNEESIFLGFCLFTLSLIWASIWAYRVWGYYFTWNIKGLWSFLTWLFFAGMCHAKFVRRWQGRVYAWLSIAGFGVVLFTYLGIGLLMNSNHPLH